MTKGLLITAGLVGLFFAVCTLALIAYGKSHYDSVAVGTSMGLTAFSLLLVASAFEARSVTASALTLDTFDNRHLNLDRPCGARARRAHHPDGRHAPRVRDRASSRPRNGCWRWCPRSLLLCLWELGKLAARRRIANAQDA